MLNMEVLLNIFILCFSASTVASQEYFYRLPVHDTFPQLSLASSHGGVAATLAVSVSAENLEGVSSSILKAERWLRFHVLAHYPSTKIDTIVVGDSVLCHRDQEDKMGLVLPSLRNIYHSLKRWDLEKEIQVSGAFSLDCVSVYQNQASSYKHHWAQKTIKPLLEYLQITKSRYSVVTRSTFTLSSDELVNMVFSHMKSMQNLGFFDIRIIDVISPVSGETEHIKRKLSFLNSKNVNPYLSRPTPVPENAEPPLDPSAGYPAPAPKGTVPPLAQVVSTPPLSFPFAPQPPPFAVPVSSPSASTFPPCNPDDSGAPVPHMGFIQNLWCVAKPSVPEETLQEAMDYACGAGGGDCEDIMPHGSCYYPDTVVAHASFAFNSYWQKKKRNGGTCSFGGTAMLIHTDPSYVECHFVLN